MATAQAKEQGNFGQMDDLDNKLAVVTGAASGIGFGICEAFLAQGMRVVMVDIESAALIQAANWLSARYDSEVYTRIVDVRDKQAVFSLAEELTTTFSQIDVVCNNAGVGGPIGSRFIWDTVTADWDWMFGVNFFGVLHGVQAFMPILLKQNAGHMVNTSSIMGLNTGLGGIYGISKHAVTRLSEEMYFNLRSSGAEVGVSVLCPGLVASKINSAMRNRPDNLKNQAFLVTDEIRDRIEKTEDHYLQQGMSALEVGERVVAAINDRQFYILTHPQMKAGVEKRFQAIMNELPPEAS